MRSAVIAFASFLATIPSVLAHGYLSSVTIDGKLYKGNIPNQTPSTSQSAFLWRASLRRAHW